MVSLLLVSTLLATHAAPSTPHRSARLMSTEDLATLRSFRMRAAAHASMERGALALRDSGISLLALCAVPVLGLVVVTAGVAFFSGLFAFVTAASWGKVFGMAMVGLLRVVPIAVWVVMGVTLVVGAGLLVASFIADAPRQKKLRAIGEERRDFMRSVNRPPNVVAAEGFDRRGEAPPQLPMMTLLTF